MRYLFISDLHLEAQRPDITRAFLRLLETRAPDFDELYILGDFFEVWLGDDTIDELGQDVVRALSHLRSQGTRVYLMHGNRDFLLGKRFCRAAGCTLLNDPTVVKLNGEAVLLMHGDSLCTLDTEYQQFRAMARSPQWQQGMLTQPLEQRRMIAQGMRMQSQGKNANKAENIMDVTPEEVVREMTDAGVQHLIHGHTHRPNVHDVDLPGGTGKRWVLGDWGALGWQIVADSELGLRLESFAIS